MSTSLHKSWALIVARTPAGLCNLLCRRPVSNFILFLRPIFCWEDEGNSLSFLLWLCSTTRAFDCNDVIGIVMLGPSFIPSFIICLEKWTQLWPLERNDHGIKTFSSLWNSRCFHVSQVPNIIMETVKHTPLLQHLLQGCTVRETIIVICATIAAAIKRRLYGIIVWSNICRCDDGVFRLPCTWHVLFWHSYIGSYSTNYFPRLSGMMGQREIVAWIWKTRRLRISTITQACRKALQWWS